MKKPEISIVVPLYNESESFHLLIERLNRVMDQVDWTVEIVLVNDGSRDHTPQLMQQVALSDERYHCVFLARNYGHQMALSAGLSVVNATNAVMIIDGDLQDPPEMLSPFYTYYLNGYDVVYAIRKKRKEHMIKRGAYFFFYRLLKKISYIDIPLDSGDFSLLSRRVVDILNEMPEESRYIRGMRSWVGFRQIGVPYERDKRAAGKSKYSIAMLFKMAYNGIFNFSNFPIKFLTNIGFLATAIALVYLVVTLGKKLLWGGVIEGFTGLLFAIILFSGVQLISLGIIGEYVLRIFFQVKGRPLYLIQNRIVNKKFVDKREFERTRQVTNDS